MPKASKAAGSDHPEPPQHTEHTETVAPTTGRRRLTAPQLGAVLVLLCCQTVMILDTSSFNIAIAAIGADFAVPSSEAASVNLGYVAAVAAMIPLSGWMGERFGTVRILIACLSVMIVGSLIGASAASLPAVVIGRIAQGIGGGGLVPLAFSLMFRNFAPANRLKIMATLAFPISIAPAVGPLIGGILVDQLSWRWVFLLNIPISLIGIVVACTLAHEVTSRSVRRLDILGAALTILGFGASVFGVQRLSNGIDPLSSGIILVLGLVAIACLVPYQLRKGSAAFLDLSLFKYRVFAKSTTISLTHSVGFMGFGLAAPLLIQTQLGASALEAGLVGVSGALGPLICSRFARRIIETLGARRTIYTSQTGIIVGLGIVTFGYSLSSIPTIMGGMFVVGASSLLTIMTCQNVGFGAVPQIKLGDATVLDGTARQISNGIGISVVTASLALTGFFTVGTLLTVIVTLGVLVCFHVLTIVVALLPGDLPLAGQHDPATADSDA